MPGWPLGSPPPALLADDSMSGLAISPCVLVRCVWHSAIWPRALLLKTLGRVSLALLCREDEDEYAFGTRESW